MTEFSEATPPLDYPFRTWAPEGEFFVPVDLRRFYAQAEPTKQDLDGYWQYGCAVTEPLEIEELRGVGGHGAMAAATFTETKRVSQLVELRGREGFPRWPHLERLNTAFNARRTEQRQARLEAAQPRCAVCGRPGAYPVAAPGFAPSRVPSGLKTCERHLSVLGVELRRLAAVDASEVLDDGRTVATAVAELVDPAFATMAVP